jgi:hypothetical protein
MGGGGSAGREGLQLVEMLLQKLKDVYHNPPQNEETRSSQAELQGVISQNVCID